VIAQARSGPPLEIESEFLQVFVPSERVRTHLPVRVRQGPDEIHAGGIDADNLAQRLQLAAPVRAYFSSKVPSRLGPPRPTP